MSELQELKNELWDIREQIRELYAKESHIESKIAPLAVISLTVTLEENKHKVFKCSFKTNEGLYTEYAVINSWKWDKTICKLYISTFKKSDSGGYVANLNQSKYLPISNVYDVDFSIKGVFKHLLGMWYESIEEVTDPDLLLELQNFWESFSYLEILSMK